MDRMINRIIFEEDVAKLLMDKPTRYKQIIYQMIDRAMAYKGKVCDKYISIDTVIGFMVQLDREYVSVREDNE